MKKMFEKFKVSTSKKFSPAHQKCLRNIFLNLSIKIIHFLLVESKPVDVNQNNFSSKAVFHFFNDGKYEVIKHEQMASYKNSKVEQILDEIFMTYSNKCNQTQMQKIFFNHSLFKNIDSYIFHYCFISILQNTIRVLALVCGKYPRR